MKGFAHATESRETERRTEAAAEAASEAAAQQIKLSEAVEWKNLFINSSQEQGFKRMKICLVQKEETLEQIAQRYQLNPREIVLYNRLNNHEVDAGQMLFIPS